MLTRDELKAMERGFNWGAFFLTGVWLMAHGRVGVGLIVLVVGLSLNLLSGAEVVVVRLAIPVGIAISLYFGFKGNSIAIHNKGYASRKEMIRAQRPWAIAGVIALCIVVAMAVLLAGDM